MENSAANSLYDLLVTRDFEPEILDSAGKSVTDPAEAELFSFNYKTENKNYGTVVVLMGAENNLEVYFGDNLGRTMESDDKQDWYDFLSQMKQFATRNMLTFNLQNLNRLKYTMQGMAAIKEGLFEGYYGTRKISYCDQPKKTRLMIRHSRDLGEDDARYRAIESIFVETADGERFKVPSRSLMHGRMLARHISEGGTPYDTFGQHITNMVAEMTTLSRFVRAAQHKDYTEEAAGLVESAIRHLRALKTKAKNMIGQRGYRESRDQFDPAEISDSETTTESIRDMFVRQTLDHRIEEALPILARLAEEQNKMKEAEEFECWSDQITEGSWSLPDTPEKIKKLQELMNQELIVGPDATNATEQLYDIFGDDELFDRLEDLALVNPDADARTVVQQRAQELGIPVTFTPADAVEPSISSDVKEFSGAPIGGTMNMKVDERGRGRPSKDEIDNRDDGLPRIGRIEKTDTGLRHYARPERGGSIPEPDPLEKLNRSLTSKLDQAYGVRYKSGGSKGVQVDEAAGQFEPVKIGDKLPKEGKIHDIPGYINIDMLPGAGKIRPDREGYSDTLYYRDPISGGIFSFYLAYGAPRVRGCDGMSEDRAAEIAQSLGVRPTQEDIDTDGVMMNRPTNCSSESIVRDELNRLLELAKI